MKTLSASTIYQIFRPSRCSLRPFLLDHGVQPAKPGPFEQVLFRLGQRHEANHLSGLGPHTDVRGGTLEERADRTRTAIQQLDPVLYQAVFIVETELNGEHVRVVGIPDFLIRRDGGYVIRDCKLSLHADEKSHPEILRQCELYAWQFERAGGSPPTGIEVVLGDCTVASIPCDGGTAALDLLGRILATNQLAEPPYEPVGWSKCQGCGFRDTCWPEAEKRRDAAIVYGVDQNLARALRDEGVVTIEDLLKSFTPETLAVFERPWGARLQKVGKSAARILQQAEAMQTGKEIRLGRPRLPAGTSFVMFDVEGLPPQMDELDKVYLWGTQLFGDSPGPYHAAVAGFGPEGDRQGWMDFLERCRAVFEQHGDIPFVHWHHYEITKLKEYVDRHGDVDGIADRIRRNCFDLLPATRDAIVLPDPSYSLKVVEQRVGYKRKLDEYGGSWSMAKFIEATETIDQAERDSIMQQIIDYNREDLEATWAVMRWLGDQM